MKKKGGKSMTTQVLLMIGIVIVVNIISEQLYFRLDLTADKSYTLSKATKNILRSLEEPVTVTAYFTEDVPPQLLQARTDFKDMLIEYANVAKGNLVYEFIDPNKDQDSEQKAMQEGIMPNIVNVRERDQMTQKRVFLGAVLKMGNDKEIIPVVQSGTAMEYSLSSSIKKLSVTQKPLVGYVQGHGEPSMNALQQVMASLGVLYSVQEINLDDPSADLMKYAAIALVAPTDTIPPGHLGVLDQYLSRGGNLFIAYNKVKGDFSTVSGSAIYTGLEDWLAGKGLFIDNNFLVDATCGTVGVQQQAGFMSYTTNISFPYLPVIQKFADHPVTKGLEQVLLPFASTIQYNGDTTMTFTPFAFSSPKSGTVTPPVYFDINKKWTDRDFPLSGMTVAGVLSGSISGNAGSRIILVGDGDFPVNGEGQRPQQLQPDNINLMVNAVDWLSDETGLIDLRTKAITARPLDEVDEGRKLFLKWLNFLLPIILIILYGIFRNQRNRGLRVKRMEEGYV
ncbi:MAG: GldG family protein [Bacteroidales bacterium]|nr:GldG family protein [Bacteroidales bacterium]